MLHLNNRGETSPLSATFTRTEVPQTVWLACAVYPRVPLSSAVHQELFFGKAM